MLFCSPHFQTPSRCRSGCFSALQVHQNWCLPSSPSWVRQFRRFFWKKASKNEDEPFFGGGDKVGCCKYCQVEVNSNFIQKDIFGIFVMTYGAQTFAIKDRCKWLNGRNIHKTSTSSLCGRRNCNCALHQLIFILPPAGRFFLIEMMWGFLTWGWLKSLGHLIGTVSK